jgi:hypothetical protein
VKQVRSLQCLFPADTNGCLVFSVSFGLRIDDWLLKTQITVSVNCGSSSGSLISHTQTLSHNSQWDPSMLRNPHVATESPSIMDRVLSVRNLHALEQFSGRLTASEAGFAMSVEKAFVNALFLRSLDVSSH